jgi:hypothetical protein
MGLNVAVFVPEGIVLASDSLAFLRQEDEGFLASSKRTFTIGGKFVISFVGNGYINGKPYGCVVQIIENIMTSQHKESTESFVNYINNFLKHIQQEGEESITVYVAGSTVTDIGLCNELFLIEHNKVIKLNHSNGQGEVYNYHLIGRSFWTNKLILPTTYEDEHSDTRDFFEEARIDFSKYSLEDAKNFACFLIRTTVDMDNFTQTRASVDLNITTCIVTSQSAVEVRNQ